MDNLQLFPDDASTNPAPMLPKSAHGAGRAGTSAEAQSTGAIMSKWTPTNQRAIAWWASTHNAVPQLSLWPKVTFKLKDTGETIDQQIVILTSEYQAAIKQERRDNARLKKQQEASNNVTRRN